MIELLRVIVIKNLYFQNMINREAIKPNTAIIPAAFEPAADPATHEFLALLATKPDGHSLKQVLLIKTLDGLR